MSGWGVFVWCAIKCNIEDIKAGEKWEYQQQLNSQWQLTTDNKNGAHNGGVFEILIEFD